MKSAEMCIWALCSRLESPNVSAKSPHGTPSIWKQAASHSKATATADLWAWRPVCFTPRSQSAPVARESGRRLEHRALEKRHPSYYWADQMVHIRMKTRTLLSPPAACNLNMLWLEYQMNAISFY